MNVPFRDLAVRDPQLKADLLSAVDRVLTHGRLLHGPEEIEFEATVARWCGRKYGIGVSSGTDAVYLALRALDIGAGDEVIMPALSWIATANPVAVLGATPVFVDVGNDLNIDVERIERAITPRTKAILPVHFTGQMCAIERIVAIADRRGIPVIEDGAQAFGATRHGAMCGSFGRLACFSMNPMKVYNSYGEAGAIVTDDAALHDRLRILRYAGVINKQDCHWPSLNFRLDTVQAAMLLVSLRYLPAKIERRRAIADRYGTRLANLVSCPREQPGNRHIYFSYQIQTDRRDGLRDHLATRGIESQVQHPIPMPHHTAYEGKYRSDAHNAEALVKRTLCLPNQENLTMEEVDYVSASVGEFLAA